MRRRFVFLASLSLIVALTTVGCGGESSGEEAAPAGGARMEASSVPMDASAGAAVATGLTSWNGSTTRRPPCDCSTRRVSPSSS